MYACGQCFVTPFPTHSSDTQSLPPPPTTPPHTTERSTLDSPTLSTLLFHHVQLPCLWLTRTQHTHTHTPTVPSFTWWLNSLSMPRAASAAVVCPDSSKGREPYTGGRAGSCCTCTHCGDRQGGREGRSEAGNRMYVACVGNSKSTDNSTTHR